MIKRIALTATALLALAGCASPKYVVSDVTRYHTLGTPSGESFSGRTFAIVAVSPDQEQSIAFRQFGDQINNRLTSLGMHQFQGSAPTGADYVVTLDYDVRGPTTDVEINQPHFAFGFGYGHFRRPYGYGGFGYGGGYDPFWDAPTIDTRQMFTRRVELDMYRGSTYTNGPKQRIFEGRAVSTGQNGQIEPVMPYMLDAVFKDFPGRSGRSDTVTVQVPDSVENAKENTVRPAARSSF